MAQESEADFKVTDRRRRPPGDTAPTAPTPSEPPPPAAERSLTGLFMTLAAEAMMALGEEPDPATGRRQPELPHAAGLIDLLVLLRERTEGHRTVEETQVLAGLIYDLQLRYVRAVKSAR